MIKKKEKTIEIMAWLLVVTFLICGFTDTIDTSLPAGSDDPAEADDNMRRIQGGFQELGDVEHDYGLSGTEITGDGKHTDITTDSITNAGALENTGDVNMLGDAAVAGTLGVTGVATIGDASLLATSAAPTTDAMIVNKKYVDDNVGSANYTPTTQAGASESLGEITFPNGMQMKWGVKENFGENATVVIDFTDEGLTDFNAEGFQGFATYKDPTNVGEACAVTAISSSSISVNNGGANGADIRWFAIGR